MQNQDYGKPYRDKLIKELERSKKEDKFTIILLFFTMFYFIGHIAYAVFILYNEGLL